MRKVLLLLLTIFVYGSMVSFVSAATGIIEIYSEPSGAKVYIDGTYVGKTPYQNVEISTGVHKIRIELNKDYPTQYWDVIIDAISPQTKTFHFKTGPGGHFSGKEMEQEAEKYKGSAQFASIPTGATVYINGEQKKKTPIGFADVPVGKYNIEFRLNGKSLKGIFDVVRNKTVKLVADFSKSKIINESKEDNDKSNMTDVSSEIRKRLVGFSKAVTDGFIEQLSLHFGDIMENKIDWSRLTYNNLDKGLFYGKTFECTIWKDTVFRIKFMDNGKYKIDNNDIQYDSRWAQIDIQSAVFIGGQKIKHYIRFYNAGNAIGVWHNPDIGDSLRLITCQPRD